MKFKTIVFSWIFYTKVLAIHQRLFPDYKSEFDTNFIPDLTNAFAFVIINVSNNLLVKLGCKKE